MSALGTQLLKGLYANALLFGVSDYLLQRVQRVQNLAARIIKKLGKFDHITDSLMSLHWLPVKSRIQFKVLLYVYKSLHGRAPSYIAEMIQLHVPSRALRSADTLQLEVPKVKTVSFGNRNFAKAAPTLWNALPADIRLSNSLLTFKHSLKTHLFKMAYCNSD